MFVVLSMSAQAASLDILEVGGAYGTPAATNPSALWWNPAGLAVAGGKLQVLVEAAPTFGRVTAQRDNPDYGTLDPAFAADGFPTTYDYSGTDRLSFTGVVPFLGVSTAPIPGLAVGLGLAVPSGKGGASDQEFGANRFAVRDGSVLAIDAIAGGAYRIADVVSLGASLHVVNSSWYANSDYATYVDLAEGVEGASGQLPETFQDGFIEDRAYSSTIVLGGQKDGGGHGALHDTKLSFGAGVYLTPLGDKLGVSLGYDHGVRLENTGDLTMIFACPPEYDAPAHAAATDQDLCDRTVQGEATIGYRLPSRVHLGVMVSPIEKVRLEVMGAYVFWSAFTDYDIETTVLPDQFPNVTSPIAALSSQLLSQKRQWARDAEDTYWVGLDAKARLTKLFTGGARVVYDRHAIPDEAVSGNNIDADTVIVGLLAQVDPVDNLAIGLSYSHYFLSTRTVTDSAFGMTLDQASARPDRYFYPSANGTYSGAIDRLGIVLRGHIGGSGW